MSYRVVIVIGITANQYGVVELAQAEHDIRSARYRPGFVFAAIFEGRDHKFHLIKRYARGLKGAP